MKNSLLRLNNIITILVMILFLFSLDGCKKKETQNVPNYSSIKTSDWRTKIGQEFEVEGYYFEERGIGKLFDKPDLSTVDGITTQADYILIGLLTNPDFAQMSQSLVGKKIRIKGILAANTEPSILTSSRLLGDEGMATINVGKSYSVLDNTVRFKPSTLINFCVLHPGICNLQITGQGKVAFLYSGGVDASYAYHRYWNDIYVLYKLLKLKYGYSDADIVVCYKDGVADDHADEVPIDFPATPAGFDGAITSLSRKMGISTKLFCFINNHGGGYEAATGTQYGLTDDNGDDTRAGVADHNTDEQIYYYNNSNTFRDDLLASKINTLPYGSEIFLLKPCFSGGLIWDLRGANRVIISSGTEFQATHSHSSGNFGDLTYNFLSAIGGVIPDGATLVNADLNSDSKISMYEAFIYINAHHTPADQPQYNDDGTGGTTTTPSSSGFGAGVFL